MEKSRRRIRLIIVLAGRKRGEFAKIDGKPRRCLRQKHKPVLDHGGLGMHPHDFVAVGNNALGCVEAV
jgi:hypothetical protein